MAKREPTEQERSRWAAERTEKVELAKQQLQQGLQRLQTNEGWTAMLAGMARRKRFSPGRYSFRNQLIVECACAEAGRPHCEQVATYKAWQRAGRTVRKGERAIYILRPNPFAREVENKQTGAKEQKAFMLFKPVAVFDGRQTDGPADPPPRPLPQVADQDFHSSVELLREVALALPGQVVIAITLGDRDGQADGWYRRHDRRIHVVTQDRSHAQAFHTLVHEVAHAILHGDGDHHAYPMMEVEAESTAFVVCTALGLDVADAAFNYVAIWGSRNAGDKDASRLVLQSGDRISKASTTILDALLGRQEVDEEPESEPAEATVAA